MAELAPSVLSADFARLGEEIRAVEQAGVTMLHLDVMDGHFVPNLTIGPPVIRSIRRATRLKLDTHLMIEDADSHLEAFADAGADMISVHVEACRHLHRTVKAIHALGKQAGVVLNPATPISALSEILPEADYVLLMSVNPGFGGQTFIPATVAKVAALKEMIARAGLKTRIEVDGGVTKANAAALVSAGADILVAGSAVFDGGNASEQSAALLGLIR